jgi:hypothetical protein
MDYHDVCNKAGNWDKMEVLDSSYEKDVWILLDDLFLCILQKIWVWGIWRWE